MNIIAQNITDGRKFGMHDVSNCNDINEVLGLLNVGEYSATPIDDICEGYQVIKDDFASPVAIVSDTYDLLQPLEAFAYFDSLKDHLGFNYTKAGFTHGGRRMEIHAECGDLIVGDPKVGDIMKKRICCRSSFDGTISTEFLQQALRAWCTNGCGNWINDSFKIKARHTKNQRVIMENAINDATGVTNIFMLMQEDANRMAEHRVHEDVAKVVIERMFPNDTTRTENVRSAVLSEFNCEERGTFGKTAWDLFNAFTAYRNHHAPTREGKKKSAEENKHHNIYHEGFAKKVRRTIAEVANLY